MFQLRNHLAGGVLLQVLDCALVQVINGADDLHVFFGDHFGEDGLRFAQLLHCLAHVFAHGIIQEIAFLVFGVLDSRLDRLNERFDMRIRLAAFDGRVHGSATGVSKDDDDRNTEVFDGVFEAALDGIVDDISGNTNYKQVAETFIEDDFRRDAGIGTAEDSREGVLCFGNRLLSFDVLMWMDGMVYGVTTVPSGQLPQSDGGRWTSVLFVLEGD